ncbi:MAG: ATP-binding cassette domain-containing protein [Acidianus sp.]|jgi:ABC-type sugar transport system ATPase subunit|nr:ATP-binding cassette domain-containing protein [Acidianus sp.]
MLRYVYIKLIFKRFIHKELEEFFVKLGPSGAGKSTLLKVIAGLVDAGKIIVDGKDITNLPPEKGT